MSKEQFEALGYKSYENEEIIVYWNPNMCKHAGLCVKGNNLVFDSKRRPWIDLENATGIMVAKIIDTCPSKALQYELKININFELDKNRSVAIIGNEIIGECEFDIKDNKWVINHTGVDESYGGRGIAKKLVEAIIFNARKNNIKILPVCGYAKKIIINNDEYKDVL